MSTNTHLLQFRINGHLQKCMETLNPGTSLFPKKQIQKFLTLITLAILHFSHQNALTKFSLWVLCNLLFFDETIKNASRWLILAQRMQNLEFVNLKCATYTKHLHLSPGFEFPQTCQSGVAFSFQSMEYYKN